MMDIQSDLFSLLRYYVGYGSRCPAISTDSWQDIYDTAKDHALTGILFSVVEKYPKEETASKALLRDWLSDSIVISRNNRSSDEVVGKLFSEFKAAGHRCVLLKGQGAALMYPTPKYRSSGDIDLWVDGERDSLVDLIRHHYPSAKICYHHGDYGKVDGIPVEIHFLPSWLYNPFRNRKLQAYFRKELDADIVVSATIGEKEVSIPGPDFNAVFMLAHMYKHIFNEGLGLRQLMDYYFVLNDVALDRKKVVKTIKSVGLTRFAKAVMFVQSEVFGLPEEKMLFEPNEKIGQFLLEDVMKAGNFGSKEREDRRKEGKKTGRLAYKQSRLWRYFVYFPSEVLWAPVWKAWHWIWRCSKGYLHG